MLATESPFPQYFELNGSPLDAGKLYFGLPNQDPETNPIPVYWDAAGTQPAVQPIRTLNGYAARAGTPALVYVDGDYSINVRNKKGELLYYAANSAEFSNDVEFAQFIDDLADPTDPTEGDALVAMKRTDIAGVATNLHLWHNANVWNVKAEFGAVGDGVTDDTAAIQALMDKIDAFQTLQVSAELLTRCVAYFPDGNYKVSAAIKVHGFIAILGTGTAYNAGSFIRQHTANTNIFEFYGSSNDARSLGIVVEGMGFEFLKTLPNVSGVALYFPRMDEGGTVLLQSNSHYIRRCRFGGWHAKGRFIDMRTCNDVEISGCVVDVCDGASITLGDQNFPSGPSDVRIFGCNFYAVQISILVQCAEAVTITGNTFSGAGVDVAGWNGVRLASNAAITQGRIKGITITGNTFWNYATPLNFDGSATNVIFANNALHQCLRAPILAEWATDFKRISIQNNVVDLAPTYTGVEALLKIQGGGFLKDSFIQGNMIDANGLNTVTALMTDTGTASWLGSGCVVDGNFIYNNTSKLGGNTAFVPVSTKQYKVEKTFSAPAAAFPVNAPLFTFSTINVGDMFTFDLEWECTLNKAAVNVAGRIGRTRISVALWNGAAKLDATLLSSVADDLAAVGAPSWPTVTFALVANQLCFSVTTGGGLVAPAATLMQVKALNFFAQPACTVAIKPV